MQKRRMWTPTEEAKLVKLSESDNLSLDDIAKKLNRSREACRIKLQDIRRRTSTTPVKIVLTMPYEAYNELAKGAEALKELERVQKFSDAIFNDYLRLYNLCEEMLKAYRNHRNMKQYFDKLVAEMEDRMPCPF